MFFDVLQKRPQVAIEKTFFFDIADTAGQAAQVQPQFSNSNIFDEYALAYLTRTHAIVP